MVYNSVLKIGSYIKAVFLKSEVPVWLTIVFAVSGAFAAYYVAPLINETFELQRARREFVIGGLNSIASETTSIVEQANKLASSNREAEWNEARDGLFSSLRRAQFEAVKLILVSEEGSSVVVEYQEALQNMQRTMESVEFRRDADYNSVRLLSRDVAEKAVRVNVFLLEIVGLR